MVKNEIRKITSTILVLALVLGCFAAMPLSSAATGTPAWDNKYSAIADANQRTGVYYDRGNASGDKITSNAHSGDYPGVYFRWDDKQKCPGVFLVEDWVFDMFVGGTFSLTAKNSNSYYKYEISRSTGIPADDNVWVYGIPKEVMGKDNKGNPQKDELKNINMVFIDGTYKDATFEIKKNWFDGTNQRIDDVATQIALNALLKFNNGYKLGENTVTITDYITAANGKKITVTETAPVGYLEKDGKASQTITVKSHGLPAEVTFNNKVRTDLSYVVNYLEQGTNKVLATQKVVGGQAFGTVVTESAIDIAGYNKVAPTSAAITIAVSGNVINFYYTARTDLCYVVNYLEEGTNNVLATQKVVGGQVFGTQVTEDAIDITGYNKVAPTRATITIAVDGNVINFYYTARTDLCYVVNYLELDTNVVLAGQKSVGGQTFGTDVTENAIDIAGYNKVAPTSAAITIAVSGNVINFYYTARTVEFNVIKTVEGEFFAKWSKDLPAEVIDELLNGMTFRLYETHAQALAKDDAGYLAEGKADNKGKINFGSIREPRVPQPESYWVAEILTGNAALFFKDVGPVEIPIGKYGVAMADAFDYDALYTIDYELGGMLRLGYSAGTLNAGGEIFPIWIVSESGDMYVSFCANADSTRFASDNDLTDCDGYVVAEKLEKTLTNADDYLKAYNYIEANYGRVADNRVVTQIVTWYLLGAIDPADIASGELNNVSLDQIDAILDVIANYPGQVGGEIVDLVYMVCNNPDHGFVLCQPQLVPLYAYTFDNQAQWSSIFIEKIWLDADGNEMDAPVGVTVEFTINGEPAVLGENLVRAGDYVVSEVVVDGYTLVGDNDIDVTVVLGGKETVVFTNQIVTGGFSFTKMVNENGENRAITEAELVGISFALYKDEDCVEFWGSAKQKGDYGEVFYFEKVPVGVYYLKENIADNSIFMGSIVWKVTVGENGLLGFEPIGSGALPAYFGPDFDYDADYTIEYTLNGMLVLGYPGLHGTGEIFPISIVSGANSYVSFCANAGSTNFNEAPNAYHYDKDYNFHYIDPKPEFAADSADDFIRAYNYIEDKFGTLDANRPVTQIITWILLGAIDPASKEFDTINWVAIEAGSAAVPGVADAKAKVLEVFNNYKTYEKTGNIIDVVFLTAGDNYVSAQPQLIPIYRLVYTNYIDTAKINTAYNSVVASNEDALDDLDEHVADPIIDVVVVSADSSAVVEKRNGNQNGLTITVTETLSDGTTNTIQESFTIDNNAKGTYDVEGYTVYVAITGGTKIADCYIVK